MHICQFETTGLPGKTFFSAAVKQSGRKEAKTTFTIILCPLIAYADLISGRFNLQNSLPVFQIASSFCALWCTTLIGWCTDLDNWVVLFQCHDNNREIRRSFVTWPCSLMYHNISCITNEAWQIMRDGVSSDSDIITRLFSLHIKAASVFIKPACSGN